MAKKISLSVIIALIFVSFGCATTSPVNKDSLPPRVSSTYYQNESFISANADEMSIVNKVEQLRTDYKRSLEALVDFYLRNGNNEKYENAKTELYSLNTMIQYDYFNVLIIEGLEPKERIPDADLLYDSAMLDKKEAEKYGIAFANKNLYRSALNKFKQLIKTYKTSDKVDDAIYYAGVILENLSDYPEALDFYKKVYEINPDNGYPARLKAARILDKYMKDYAAALPLYKEGIKIEGTRSNTYYEIVKNAEERVKILEKTVEQ